MSEKLDRELYEVEAALASMPTSDEVSVMFGLTVLGCGLLIAAGAIGLWVL